MIVDLKPKIQNRWLKYNLIEKHNDIQSTDSINTQTNSADLNLYSQFEKNKVRNSTNNLNETQKYNMIKPIFEEITKLMC